MIEYISKFFTIDDFGDLIAKVILVLLVATVYFVLFYYAKKRNLDALIWVVCASLLVLFGLSFFKIDNFNFYVYFVVCLTGVGSVIFFAKDFKRDIFRRAWTRWFDKKELLTEEYSRDDLHKSVTEIIKACQRLSKMDVGALILVADDISDQILESGTTLNCQVSADLLETVFFPKTPLHDGAVVIMANKVVAAGCYLPLTQQTSLPRDFGTRHRAAIGVTELHPSLTAIVVSEETGIISAMRDGKIKRYLDADQLKSILECAMRLKDNASIASEWGITDNDEE